MTFGGILTSKHVTFDPEKQILSFLSRIQSQMCWGLSKSGHFRSILNFQTAPFTIWALGTTPWQAPRNRCWISYYGAPPSTDSSLYDKKHVPVVGVFFATKMPRIRSWPPKTICELPWKKNNSDLGGGFKYFLFSPLLGEMIQFDKYFSDGLVQPPPSDICKYLYVTAFNVGTFQWFIGQDGPWGSCAPWLFWGTFSGEYVCVPEVYGTRV